MGRYETAFFSLKLASLLCAMVVVLSRLFKGPDWVTAVFGGGAFILGISAAFANAKVRKRKHAKQAKQSNGGAESDVTGPD